MLSWFRLIICCNHDKRYSGNVYQYVTNLQLFWYLSAQLILVSRFLLTLLYTAQISDSYD